MQAQGQARSVRSSGCRLPIPTFIFLAKLAVSAAILALPGFFACDFFMRGDYVVGAVCVVFYVWLGTASSMAFCMFMDDRCAPPETPSRRHTIDVSEDAFRANFEQVCPAKTVAEKQDVEGGVVNADDLPYAEDEPCIICLERKEATQPCRVLFCKHAYHKQCIDEWWLRKRDRSLRCPICRQEQPMRTFVSV
mmetsp:Transcript_9241/g.24852  ORF Transcript_9241/g.24852 Transcript_9241/m.24852 type:complete len:193 (-) Transcript_9241:187-765(-)